MQYGERVWGITSGTKEERIDEAIDRTEEFFRSLGLTTRLHEENIGKKPFWKLNAGLMNVVPSMEKMRM